MADIVVDDSTLNLKLGKLEPEVHDALVVACTIDAGELLGRMQSLASGDLVQVRSGKFVKSFKASVRQRQNRVQATVGSKSPIAHILEGGASIPAHDILPKDKQALLMRMRTGNIFAARVKSPGGKIDARMVVHTAFDQMKSDIEADLIQAGKGAAANL